MSIKLKGSSDGSVSFDAPADTSPSGSDITLVLPTTVGSAEQFLKNSGTAGTLEFSSMVETSTGVGIGTSSPSHKLNIDSTSDADLFQIRSTADTNETRLRFGISGTVAEIHASGGSSGNLAFKTYGSERMRIDTTGNVGIATSTISGANLVIATNSNGGSGIKLIGKSANGGAEIDFRNNADSTLNGFIEFNDNGGILSTVVSQPQVFRTNNTERMRIDSDGRLLLGLTSSIGGDAIFQVQGSGNRKAHFHQPDSGGSIIQFTNTTTGTGTSDGFEVALNGSEDGQIWLYESGSIKFGTANTERMRIDSSGRVGIGATPNDFDGNGDNLVISSSTHTGLTIDATSSTNCSIHFADGSTGNEAYRGYIVYSNSDDSMRIGTAATERMRITSAGLARISSNTSDSDYYTASDEFHLVHTSYDNRACFIVEHSGNSNPYGIAIDFSDAAPDNNGEYFLRCFDNSTNRLYIYSDGDVDNHDNSYGSISDQKLKQDIVDAGSQWDDLKNLRVRKFKFKSDVAAYGDEAKTLIGLVAQEAETVSPGLVKDKADVDEDGNDLGTVTKSIRYSVLYMKAVKALQEAMDRIETLEAKVAALEAQ